MTVTSLILLGFMLGLRHAMDADHVAAVASLAVDRQSLMSVAGRGALWGCGHTLTLGVVAALVLIAGIPFPDGAERWLELAVALMLIGLGANVIRRVIRDRLHVHTHTHANGSVHWHAHSHGAAVAESHEHRHSPIKPLVIGMVHGLAGSAALLLLVLEGLRGDAWLLGMAYVLMFGLGSVVGMACLSVVISLPFRIGSKGLRWQNGLSVTTGLATVSIGVWLLWDLWPAALVMPV